MFRTVNSGSRAPATNLVDTLWLHKTWNLMDVVANACRSVASEIDSESDQMKVFCNAVNCNRRYTQAQTNKKKTKKRQA